MITSTGFIASATVLSGKDKGEYESVGARQTSEAVCSYLL